MPRRINGSKASNIKIGNSALAYSRYSETALGADGWEDGS